MDEVTARGLRREPTEIVRRFLRPARAEVTVSPPVVSPRQSIEVRVTTPKPIRDVTSARIELGYHNFFRYRWAGRADAAATAATNAMWLTEDVGTTYGTDRNTTEWISLLTAEIPTSTSEFTDGSASFRIPSWAPPSSPQIAEWSCRLILQRRGADVDEAAEFTVITGPDDAPTDIGAQERVTGSAACRLEIELPRAVFRAGETIEGSASSHRAGICPWATSGCAGSGSGTPIPALAHRDSTKWSTGAQCNSTNRCHCTKPHPCGCRSTRCCPWTPPRPPAPSTRRCAGLSNATMFYAGFASPGTESVRRPIAVVSAVGVE